MPSNEQRREAAKRKLERQLVRRAERARRRKQLTIAGSILGVVAVVAVVSVVFVVTRGDDDASTAQDSTTSAPADSIIAAGRTEPLPETVKDRKSTRLNSSH